MANSNILYKPGFWLLFTAIIIIALYIYGRNILDDRSELTLTRKALQERTQELSSSNEESDKKSKKIDELNKTISEKNNIITEKTKTISDLANSISELNYTINEKSNVIIERNLKIQELNSKIIELKNKPPVTETKYLDKIIYKEKPEPYHPYGKGYGNLTLFKTCNCYNLKFWIDGEYAGQTNTKFYAKPNCGEKGTVTKAVIAGKHHIKAKDEENHSWEFYITINEDQCLVKGVNIK